MKNKIIKELKLNGGNVKFSIDNRGNIFGCVINDDNGEKEYVLEVSAKELDVIAGRVKLMSDFRKAWGNAPSAIEYSHGEEHHIDFDNDGNYVDPEDIIEGVRFGCQWIGGSDVSRVHKLSLAIRSRASKLRGNKNRKKQARK